MKKTGNRLRISALVLGIFMCCILNPGPHAVAAHVTVYDRDSLKEELQKDGSRVIELAETVTIRSTLKVCGNKVLTGPGEIKRAIANESAFGGNLLRLAGGSLTLKNITINGRGDAGVLSGKLYGRLIQVDSGQLTIGSGAVLKNNKNSSRLSDGGGAVRVKSGGSLVMTGGSVSGNVSITPGAGIRIDSGGACSIKGGSINYNKVVGKSNADGFDGRGGGIYNKGTLAIYGGSINSNSVSGCSKGGRVYGGVGGGIANAGSLLLSGGSVTGNHGSKGSDLGLIGGRTALNGQVKISECWLRSGQRLHVGGNFHGARIRIVPESIKEGVRLADGLSGKAWKKQFSYPSSLTGKRLKVVLKNGTLIIKKKEIKKPAPTPSPTPDGGSYGVTSGGHGYVPHTVSTPRPHPSYLPVSTIDPMAEILLVTAPPSFILSHTEVPTQVPTVTPATGTPTSAPTPVPTPEPTVFRPAQTLPTYLLFPQTELYDTARSVETHIPIMWRFSKRDIITIKKEMADGDERVSGELFLRRIRGNIIEGDSSPAGR